jgi:hypothetical protein
VIRFVIRLAAFAITANALHGISSRAPLRGGTGGAGEGREGDVDHGNGTLPLRFAKSILSHAARTEAGTKMRTTKKRRIARRIPRGLLEGLA